MTEHIRHSSGFRLFRVKTPTSCEAAIVVKPKVRLGEPWVTMVNICWSRGAAMSPALRAPLFGGEHGFPRLTKPRLGLSYMRCSAARLKRPLGCRFDPVPPAI